MINMQVKCMWHFPELPNPCVTEDADGNTQTLELECLVCKNSQTEEECLGLDTFETCAGEDVGVTHLKTYNPRL